jgi:hypothetical protein
MRTSRKLFLWPSMTLALWVGACGGEGAPKGEDGPVDADGDGFTSEEDCDDADAARFPGAPEPCNGVDDDCDGLDDLTDPDLLTEGVVQYAVDSDLDGYGDPLLSTAACASSPMPRGAADNRLDCDDRNDDIHPEAEERCDGIDNDCDTLLDAEDDSIRGLPFWGPDEDGDGFGDAAVGYRACERPAPDWIENAADCDDSADDVFPGNLEVCGDGRDNDCDGVDGAPYFVGGVELACGQGATNAEGPALEVGELGGDASRDVAYAALDGVGVLLTTTGPAETLAHSFSSAPSLSAGVEELWVGDSGASGGAGSIYLISGDWDDGHATADLTLRWTGTPGDQLGLAVLAVDDQADDGQPDLLVASASGLWHSADRAGGAALSSLPGLGESSGLRVLQRAGDLDGDGVSDHVAADPTDDGAVWILLGPIGAAEPDRLAGDSGDGLGASVSGGQDLDDDGKSDLLVGAPGNDVAYIVLGEGIGSGLISGLAFGRLEGPARSAAGAAVAMVGDMNNDEQGDIAVGAPRSADGGLVFVAAGPFGGTQPLLAISATVVGAPGDAAGRALAGPGDRNGDSFTDLIVAGDTLITTFYGQRTW